MDDYRSSKYWYYCRSRGVQENLQIFRLMYYKECQKYSAEVYGLPVTSCLCMNRNWSEQLQTQEDFFRRPHCLWKLQSEAFRTPVWNVETHWFKNLVILFNPWFSCIRNTTYSTVKNSAILWLNITPVWLWTAVIK